MLFMSSGTFVITEYFNLVAFHVREPVATVCVLCKVTLYVVARDENI